MGTQPSFHVSKENMEKMFYGNNKVLQTFKKKERKKEIGDTKEPRHPVFSRCSNEWSSSATGRKGPAIFGAQTKERISGNGSEHFFAPQRAGGEKSLWLHTGTCRPEKLGAIILDPQCPFSAGFQKKKKHKNTRDEISRHHSQ